MVLVALHLILMNLKHLIFLIVIPIHLEFNDQVNDYASDQANKLTKEQIEVLKYCKHRTKNIS